MCAAAFYQHPRDPVLPAPLASRRASATGSGVNAGSICVPTRFLETEESRVSVRREARGQIAVETGYPLLVSSS